MNRIFKFRNLVKALIIIAVFFRGNLRDYLMMGVSTVWLAINIYFYAKPKIKSLIENAKVKFENVKMSVKEKYSELNCAESENEFDEDKEIVEEANDLMLFKDTQDFFIRNVNFRITDKLRKVYPKVTWSWASNLVDTNGKIKNAQIKTENTGEFNMADVSFLPSGEINFKMLKVVDFKEKESKEPDKLSEEDVKAWYDACAFGIINDTINEICSQGYKYMEIEEDGSIYIKEQNEKVQCNKIDNMVEKNLWNDLVKCLKKDDIKANILSNKLVLSWGGKM